MEREQVQSSSTIKATEGIPFVLASTEAPTLSALTIIIALLWALS